MALWDEKKGAAALIIRKIGSGLSSDSPKPEMEEMRPVARNEQGDEIDSSSGLQVAVEEMMSAVEAKRPEQFKSALISFLTMWMDEQESEEESD